MSNTPMTVNALEATAMREALRVAQIHLGDLMSDENRRLFNRCEGMCEAALRRIRQNEERIASRRLVRR